MASYLISEFVFGFRIFGQGHRFRIDATAVRIREEWGSVFGSWRTIGNSKMHLCGPLMRSCFSGPGRGASPLAINLSLNRRALVAAPAETFERFYKMADERKVPLCELLEEALDALEGAGASSRS